MDVLITLLVLIISQMYMYIMLYTFNTYNFIFQVYPDKAGGGKEIMFCVV